jgi:hypothetical protein
MEKQTAVEWLENQIKTSKYFYKLMADINSRSTVAQSDIFEQAKEMEKKEIMDAFDEGKSDGYKTAREWDEMILWSSAEQYFNQTFKKD